MSAEVEAMRTELHRLIAEDQARRAKRIARYGEAFVLEQEALDRAGDRVLAAVDHEPDNKPWVAWAAFHELAPTSLDNGSWTLPKGQT